MGGEFYETQEENDTVRWAYKFYDTSNISRHAHAYMLIIGEIEDDDDMEVDNEIVLTTQKDY